MEHLAKILFSWWVWMSWDRRTDYDIQGGVVNYLGYGIFLRKMYVKKTARLQKNTSWTRLSVASLLLPELEKLSLV